MPCKTVRRGQVSALLPLLLASLAACTISRGEEPPQPATYRLATFHADVTIPLNHRCMGILPTKSKEIVDPLEAHGFVLLGPDKPIVVVAVDWCEIRNASYDAWRSALAQAAGTDPVRVLVSSLHQHDAPVVDDGAQQLLDLVGLAGELFDRSFHDQCLTRIRAAVTESLPRARTITHLGIGMARVAEVASNRRVVDAGGRVSFGRGSSSGADPTLRAAPDGLIDPYLKTLSFWEHDQPLLAWHAYATHPMSFYGKGSVSADFVGLARRLQARAQPGVAQIYASGCSGDVTAGKYNDGSPAMRPALAQRLFDAMQNAWQVTLRYPLRDVQFRHTGFDLPFNDSPAFRREAMEATLRSPEAPIGDRILAAMSLSSLNRIERGQQIDLPCLDFGPAQVVLFPGESFVGYQLLAQELRPDSFVMSIGYGECWPGYIPTRAAFADNFDESWRWVSSGSPPQMEAALRKVLVPAPVN